MGTKKKTINCDIGETEHRAARHRSFDTGQTLGEVITEALREHLVPSLTKDMKGDRHE